ncbi:4680_t:CDS:2, partial [Racocetra persica]
NSTTEFEAVSSSGNKTNWALCYTQTRFIAGIQSIQRVKSMNAIIKKEVSRSSTLLYLIDAIQNRLPYVANHYFSAIDSLIQKYLTPHVLSLQRQQLSESFLYNVSEITYEWDNNIPEPANIIENGYLEDDYERSQTCLNILLQPLSRDDVVQI